MADGNTSLRRMRRQKVILEGIRKSREHSDEPEETIAHQVLLELDTILRDDALEPGLYRIHWRSGGQSLAAVGQLRNGQLWLAPTNWVAPITDYESGVWDQIAYAEKLDTRVDAEPIGYATPEAIAQAHNADDAFTLRLAPEPTRATIAVYAAVERGE